MAKKKIEHETVMCPVGKFFSELEKVSGRRSKFFVHLDRSRVEFLKAVRSLVDERIEDLERKAHSKEKKRAT
ncbi:MAG: hypothetical protein PVG99_15240, partial [Desulfobacteraceae bacterium]